MGRPHDGIRQGYDLLVKGVGNDSVRDIVALTGQEVVDVLDRAAPTETITATHDLKLPLNGKNELAAYLMCTGANIVATDTLTFKFYIRETINGVDSFNEIYQAANYTVTTAGVTAGQVKKFAVTDTDNIIKNATHYSVAASAGIAMPANCYGVLLVGKNFDVDNAISITGAITIDSTTPVNVTETNSANIKTAVEKIDTGDQKTQIVDGGGNVIGSTANRLNVHTVTEANEETSATAVDTWIELDENIKAVSFVLDCTSSTEASLEYTFDRSATPSGVITSELGTLENDKEGGYLAGAVAQVRMNNVVDNEVVAVPTETKITFATDVPTTGDTIVFGDETYEFTTDSTTELTEPANIRIDMDTLSITDVTTAAQGFKTVFNTNTAYDVAATGNEAAITLTASDNFEAYNDLATTTSITATATATYEDTTFGGGTGDSTTGVDAVAATLPKLWIIGVK